MENNTPETESRRKQYSETKTKNEMEKGLDSIIRTTKKGHKNWAGNQIENYL